jgi:hypothetical protein
MTSNTLRHLIRKRKYTKIIIGEPKEDCRVHTSDEEIKSFYIEISKLIRTIPSSFIFNVDEKGCSDWVDKRELQVIVPADYHSDVIDIPIDRNSKRSTLTACISADGAAMKFFIIVDRVTIDDQLRIAGYTPNFVKFVYQENAFMTKFLLDIWAKEVFFPTVAKKRLQYNYQGQAIILIDGFGAHETPFFTQECAQNKIIVKFLIPHTSDRCQPLDFITFSNLKRHYASIHCDRYSSAQSNKIVRMMRAWNAASSPDLIVSSFICTEIIPYINPANKMIFCRIDLSASLKLKHLVPPSSPVNPKKLCKSESESTKILLKNNFRELNKSLI